MSETRLTQMPETYNRGAQIIDGSLIQFTIDKIKAAHPGVFDSINWHDFKFYFIPRTKDIYAALQEAKRNTLESEGQPKDDLELAWNYPNRMAYYIWSAMQGSTGGELEVPESEYAVNRFRTYVTKQADYVIFKLRDDMEIKRRYTNPDVLFIFKWSDFPTVDDAIRVTGLTGEYTFEYGLLGTIVNDFNQTSFHGHLHVNRQTVSDNHIRVTFGVRADVQSYETHDQSSDPIENQGNLTFLLRNVTSSEPQVVFNFVRDAADKTTIDDNIEDKTLDSNLDDVMRVQN